MALTLDQLGNLGLSTAQKNVVQAAINIGNELRAGPGATPDISGITGTNAKKVETFIRDVNSLLGPAWDAVRYIRKKTIDDGGKAADDAVPGGTL